MKKALEEIQKLIDEDYPCDNTEQKIGYQYALNKVYNLLSLMELRKEEEPWVDIFKVLRDRKKQNVSEDLEKYASRAGFDYVDDIEYKYPNHRWNDHDVEFAYRDGIIAGAEWALGQGETVEGVMKAGSFGNVYLDLPDLYNYDFSPNDKVIVQIRKKIK